MKNYFVYIFSLWSLFLGILLAIVSYKFIQKENIEVYYSHQRQIAKTFLLTDFCFSTESRHVRHLSMPEYIAPFQDFPAYHDRFPSSSFFRPVIE